eukprot:462572_1
MITRAIRSFSTQPKLSRLASTKWYNAEDLKTEYESINSNMIPSVSLTNLNDNTFLELYQFQPLQTSTHWIIPHTMLIGCDPSSFIPKLINNGFTKFISLYEWKHELYEDDIKTYCENMDNIELIAFTIADYAIVDDMETVNFIDELTQNLLTMNKDFSSENPLRHMMYMHCHAGHGRTGLISSLLLQAIYGMDSKTAIKFLNEIHSMRHPDESDINMGRYAMPETEAQFDQVHRLSEQMIQIYNKYSIQR